MPTYLLTRPQRLQRLRLVYTAEMLSGLGDGVFWVGLIVAIDGSASFTALLTAAIIVRLGPRALLSYPAGSFVDRHNTQSILIGTDVARAVVMVGLGLAVGTGLPVQWALLGVLLSYLLGVPWRPALAAAIPGIAGERNLARANATISVTRQIMTFLGPVVGVAVATWSVPAAFVLNGITFALSASCIAGIRNVVWPGSSHASRPRAARDELSTAAHQVDGMSAIIPLTALMYFVRGSELVLHVLVIRDLVGVEPSAIGYLSGAIGLGALAVTPLARRWAADDAALIPVLAAVALTAIPSALLASADRLSEAALLVVPIGAGLVVFEVITVVTVQRITPVPLLGRAFGALNTASNGGKLAGALAAPFLVAATGVAEALVVVAGLVAAGGLACVIPLRRVSVRAELRRARLAPVVDRLAGLGLFSGASQVSLERLAQQIVEEHVEPGHVLIREGDHPDDLYVILTGTYDVSVNRVPVDPVGAGDWVGEIGLIHDLPRTATVTATTPSTVWRLPGALFLSVLSGSDDTSLLEDDIARRLAAADRPAPT